MSSGLAALVVAAGLAAADVSRPAPVREPPPAQEPIAGELPDPADTRLIYVPTGRTLGRGQKVIAGINAGLPIFQYGVTDRVSVGVGAIPVLLPGYYRPPVVFTPKVQLLSRESTHVAVGVLHMVSFGNSNLGLAYAVTTREIGKGSVTAGAGWLYAFYDDEHGGTPAAMIGAEGRVSSRVKFIVESYIFRTGAVPSFAVRVMGSHFAGDFGLFFPIISGEVLVAPVINLTWRFGRL